MADQFNFAAVPQAAQAFPAQYQYPVASGDQNAAPYAYPIQQPGVYAQPQPQAAQVPGYTYDQTTGTYMQSAPQAQMPASVYAQPAPQAYPAYPAHFPNQYGQIAGVPPAAPTQQAQFPQPILYNQTQIAPPSSGPVPLQPNYGYANPDNSNQSAQQPGYMNGRGGSGGNRGSFQRGGQNKFGGGRQDGYQSQQYQHHDPDGIREDTVFISCLPPDVTHEALKNQFGSVGKIKDNAKSGMPMIWIFKERGVPKGEALVTYETPQSAQAAVQYFQVRPFNGQKIEVKLATNSQRPEIRPPGGSSGGDNMHGGGMMHGGSFSGRGMSGRGAAGGRGSHQGSSGRDGDWICSGCSNKNFSWRETCNRCQGPRPGGGGGGGDSLGSLNHGNGGGQRGMNRGGIGSQRGAGGSRGGRGGGGPMRGGGGGPNRPRPSPY